MYVSGRPDQVQNCTITNISMTSLGVKCAEGFNGGLLQSFMLEVRELNTLVRALISNDSSRTLKKHQPPNGSTHTIKRKSICSPLPPCVACARAGRQSELHVTVAALCRVESASGQSVHSVDMRVQHEGALRGDRSASGHAAPAGKTINI